MTQPQKNIIITYPIPDSSVIHSSTSISANLIMGAKNKFRIDNPMVQEKFITRNLWKNTKNNQNERIHYGRTQTLYGGGDGSSSGT
jgi:hypothetical protein